MTRRLLTFLYSGANRLAFIASDVTWVPLCRVLSEYRLAPVSTEFRVLAHQKSMAREFVLEVQEQLAIPPVHSTL